MRPVVLGAVTLALIFTPVVALAKNTGVKWVPLDQVQRGPAKRAVPTTPAAQPVTVRPVQPSTAVAPPTATAPIADPTSVAASAQGRLDLTCFGGGTANKATARTAYSNGYVSGNVGGTSFSGSGNSTTTVYGTRQQAFGDQVDVRLFGGDDRIRMPRTMLPLLRGGQDGWFKLKNVVADSRRIRAKAGVNFMNNPNVLIDRVTGTISISGKAGDYSGQCQAIDADAPAKF